jgi:nitrite reductase/ring-hydroxylating ferredoxin subunit
MNDQGRFERAIEKLLTDRSPRSEVAGLSDEEQRMVRIAQLLRGSRRQVMDPEFTERLHARLFSPRGISRRGAVLSGLGALAAGLMTGLGLDRVMQNGPSIAEEQLVGANGRWYPVANLADLPDGRIQPFTAGAVQGFLIHRRGRLWALSRICTHMGCTLRINQAEGVFACPCHGAEFDLQGTIHNAQEYGRVLPTLPRIKTRVTGETVEVMGA